MADASIVAVVVRKDESGLPFSPSRPFLAFVASNPQVRADGRTEEEAIDRLRTVLVSSYPGTRACKVVDLRLDELLVEEVMGS